MIGGVIALHLHSQLLAVSKDRYVFVYNNQENYDIT
jgi:hypothetical protein